MRTLLKHARTGLYFQGPEKWTENPDFAYDFRFTERALQYVATWDLTEVELAFSFENTGFEDTRSVTCASLPATQAQCAPA